MINFSIDAFPILSITFKDSDWSEPSIYDCEKYITEILRVCESEKIKIILDVRGNPHLVKQPPVWYMFKMARIVVKLRKALKDNVSRTSIYIPDNRTNLFFSILFSMFKPENPFKIFKLEHEMERWLDNENAVVECEDLSVLNTLFCRANK